MLIIGLTGGIGSGKSVVAKLFVERGITVIDTDQLSRDVTGAGTPALQEIISYFGEQVKTSDGKLDRTALRKIIFSDEKKRLWLENLLHPLIREEMKKQAENAQSPYVIVVVPLLLETKPNPLFNRILVVDAPEKLQISRTMKRDNSTQDEVLAVIKTQAQREKRLAVANDIIVNDGDLRALNTEVENLHKFYCALGAVSA